MLVVVPLAVVVAAGLLGWGYFDVGQQIARWRLPPLVPVTGRVYLNGEPLAGAQVFTQPVGVKCPGALGLADSEGRFTLRHGCRRRLPAGGPRGRAPGRHPAAGPRRQAGALQAAVDHAARAARNSRPRRCGCRSTSDPASNQFEFRMEHTVPAPKPDDGEGEKRPEGKPRGTGGPPKFMGKPANKTTDSGGRKSRTRAKRRHRRGMRKPNTDA